MFLLIGCYRFKFQLLWMKYMLKRNDEFLLLDDKNEMLPRRNIFLTVLLCLTFYYVILYDIYALEKCALIRLSQLALMTINLISLCIILRIDSGQAHSENDSRQSSINFVRDNVIYTRKIPAQRSTTFDSSFYNDDYCEKCLVIQRDFISHCRFCDVCLVNRDHHCAWFNKCIAENNFNVFLCFILSLTFSAFLIVSDTFQIFSAKVLVKLSTFQIIIVVAIMLISMSLFVLSAILSLQYLLSLILGISTKKLLNGEWEWKSIRFFRGIRRTKTLEIIDIDD
ncbi:DHHC-type Zn-finger protein [Trachipleistophora hominis]|uniref:Palmitoyltransferase n=1 Tax=Trachipleistophora hominis TaxID=72359 RepID=L7JVJ6_TRAHO|nr:DHHC-type Zn-finger protein [Trachipleistophora hominis]